MYKIASLRQGIFTELSRIKHEFSFYYEFKHLQLYIFNLFLEVSKVHLL